MHVAWVALFACLLSLAGTAWMRGYALRNQLIDQPGEARRNHVRPTPRGGGIAFAGVVLIWMGWQAFAASAAAREGWLFWCAGLFAVMAIGAWDDHRPLSARLRLAVHLGAALLLALGGLRFGWSPLWTGLTLLVAIGLINVWNFMDGIDGLAASQAVIVAMAVGLWTGQTLPWVLAAAVAGFLPFNFPRARIFMGDAGSGALGWCIAAIWGSAVHQSTNYGWMPVFPLAPFLLDSGLTLASRILRGERWWEGHSSHAYQRWVRAIGRHPPVTLAYAAWSMLGAVLAAGLASRGIHLALAILASWCVATIALWARLQGLGGSKG